MLYRSYLLSVLLASAAPLAAASSSGNLAKNGSFSGGSSHSLPPEWQHNGTGVIEWRGEDGPASIGLKSTASSQAITVTQTVELPDPSPVAILVSARVKLENIVRGEKSWYSGRILLTYLDAAQKPLGDTYSLDRLEGTADWKSVRRQFPVLPGAEYAKLELQLLNAREGTIRFSQVELRALDENAAQAWRKEAEERIDRYRKGNIKISVRDEQGNPVPDASVSVFMRRHAYPFGTAVKAHLLTQETDDSHTLTYRSVVEDFFNYATLEGELKAPSIEKRGIEPALAGLQWMKERGIRARGHVLTWPSLEMSSKAVNAVKDDPEKIREIMRKHFHDVLTATAPYGIVDWDVVNEPAFHNYLIQVLGEQQVPEWFRWAGKDAGGARLFLNENNVEFHSGNQDDMERWIELLQKEKAPIGGIGWQGHMWHRTLSSGQNILDDLDRFARFGLKIQITEYDTHERFSDEDSARFLDEFLTAWFSHPSTDGFIMWGFQDEYMWNGNGPLFRRDWSLKQSGKAWMDLVFGKWWTETTGRTDSQGEYVTRGYLGTYDIEVREQGRSLVRRAELGPDGLVLRLNLADASANTPAQKSSNPYTTGKLPALLPPRNKNANLVKEIVSLTERTGALAVVPKGESDAIALSGGRDLYLRFDLGRFANAKIEKASLVLPVAHQMESTVRVNVYVLSHRFVPQKAEAGLDWDPAKMAEGYAPGRENGEYRLGDASVVFLGEAALEKSAAGTNLTFTAGDLGRTAQALRGKAMTVILSPIDGSLTLAAPALEVYLAK